MKKAPTFEAFSRDPQIVGRFLSELDTPALNDMSPDMLRLLSDFLFKAASGKVISQIGHDRLVSQDRERVEQSAAFLDEARLFEAAGRIFRDIANQREGGQS